MCAMLLSVCSVAIYKLIRSLVHLHKQALDEIVKLVKNHHE